MATNIFDMTPVLPGTVWSFRGNVYMILNSNVNLDKTWNIESFMANGGFCAITITMQEWISEAKYITDDIRGV